MRLRYQRGGKAEGMLGVLCIAIALLWSSATRAETRVYLLRGWFGVFSTGLDSLAAELKSKGIKAETVGHLAWKTTVSNIIKDHAAGQSGPLVLASCRHYSARRRAQDPLDSHGVRELWVAMPRNDSGESTGAIWPLRATHPPGATATTPTAFSESLKGISGTTRGHCGSKVPGQQQI